MTKVVIPALFNDTLRLIPTGAGRINSPSHLPDLLHSLVPPARESALGAGEQSPSKQLRRFDESICLRGDCFAENARNDI